MMQPIPCEMAGALFRELEKARDVLNSLIIFQPRLSEAPNTIAVLERLLSEIDAVLAKAKGKD